MPAKSPVPAVLLALAMMLGLLGAVSTTTPAAAATTYKISYNANGGTGAPAAQTTKPKVGLNLSTKVPKRATYTFKGWATKASAKNPQYKPGEAFFASKSITLYAVWHLNYVALGDSYSSGEGALPDKDETQFLKDPSFGDTRACHRSPLAYSRIIDGDLTIELKSFRACSGAVTDDVTTKSQRSDGKTIAGPQADFANSDTGLITISIGGNDVGFGDIAYRCVIVEELGCVPGSQTVRDALEKIGNAKYRKKLVATYKKLLQNAPKAKLLVVGYPYISPGKDSAGKFRPICGYLSRYNSNPATQDDLNRQISAGVYKIIAKVNSMVIDAVNETAAAYPKRIYYISSNSAGNPFKGHELCTTNPFANNVIEDKHTEYSLHPNSKGQAAYASIIETFIKDKGWAK